MATTYLTRTQSSGNRKTFTVSAWVKLGNLSNRNPLTNINAGDNPYHYIEFRGDGTSQLRIEDYNGGVDTDLKTTRVFRDPSAWYHIVVAYDTTQATPANRIKLYVNGVQETSFATETYPAQDFETELNNGGALLIGREASSYFDGAMSHFYFIDGLAYAPTVFGSIDATSGEWVINTSPSVTYGTNGFLILKDGNTITDQSSNSNDFTLGGGTLTDLQDCPDDVFATGNPVCYDMATLSQGNNTQTSSGWKSSVTTLGFNSGKFYYEGKIVATASGTTRSVFGACTDGIYNQQASGEFGQINTSGNTSHGYSPNGGAVMYNTSQIDTIATATTNDIIRVALDLDNEFIYYGKNGAWENSGDPTSGATGTGGYAFPNTQGTVFFGNTTYGSSINSINYGNGYFGTTIISSEGTNASNIGKFEYDVPTGYTALSLKGLQE